MGKCLVAPHSWATAANAMQACREGERSVRLLSLSMCLRLHDRSCKGACGPGTATGWTYLSCHLAPEIPELICEKLCHLFLPVEHHKCAQRRWGADCARAGSDALRPVKCGRQEAAPGTAEDVRSATKLT